MTYKKRLWWFPFIKQTHRIEIGVLPKSIKVAGTELKPIKPIYEKDGLRKPLKIAGSIFDEIWIGYGNGVCGQWILSLDTDIMDYIINKPYENGNGLSEPLTSSGNLQMVI